MKNIKHFVLGLTLCLIIFGLSSCEFKKNGAQDSDTPVVIENNVNTGSNNEAVVVKDQEDAVVVERRVIAPRNTLKFTGDSMSFKVNTGHNEVGSVYDDSTSTHGQVIKATKTEDVPGNLIYANNVVFDKGTYKVTYRMKTDSLDPTEVIANIYMDGVSNGQPGYSKEIYAGYFNELNTYQDFDFLFKVEQDETEMTPWIFYTGQSDIFLDAYKIEKVPEALDYSLLKRDSRVYEENILGKKSGKETPDEAAVNGMSVLAVEGFDNANHLAFGPYTTDQTEGVYNAIFRLKVSNNSIKDVVAKIDVFNAEGNGVNKSLIIKANDFDSENTYQDFEIPYIRTERGSMEYRVYYYGKGSLALDNITVLGDFGDVAPEDIPDVDSVADEEVPSELEEESSEGSENSEEGGEGEGEDSENAEEEKASE